MNEYTKNKSDMETTKTPYEQDIPIKLLYQHQMELKRDECRRVENILRNFKVEESIIQAVLAEICK